MGNMVKFGAYEEEAAQEEQKEIDSSGAGADFMSLKQGRNVVRVLPPPQGKRTPFRVVHQHFVKLPGEDRPKQFICPRVEHKKHCPACTEAERLRATQNPADADLANELFARRRVFANVIDRANPEAGPRILGFGKTVHESMVTLRNDQDAGGDFTHPTSGFDIIIERTGTGKNDTKYSVKAARTSTPLHADASQMQDWIDTQHNLDSLARPPSPEELRKMFNVPEERAAAAPARKGPGRKTVQDDAIDTDGEPAD